MLKSLKTGSTTFANILFRVAVSRGMRVLRQDEGPDLSVNYTLPSARDPPMDMVISHIRGGCVQPREFPKLMSFYEEVLGTDDFTLLTTVREPVSRYLSHIKYFTFQSLKERTGRDYKLSEIVAEKKLFNVLSCVFGIYNMEDALAFIQGPIFRRILFIPIDSFDKAEAMLHQRCGWSSHESVSVPLNEYEVDMHGIYQLTPQQWDLTPEITEDIRHAHSLDNLVYNAALDQFTQLWEVTALVKQLSSTEQLLQCNMRWKAACATKPGALYLWERPECVWLQLLDVDFMQAVSVESGEVDMSYKVGNKITLDEALRAATQEVCCSEDGEDKGC